MGSPLSSELLMRAVAGLGIVALGSFFYRLVRIRMMVRALAEDRGLRLLSHSFFLGHLPLMAKIMSKHPSDVGGYYMFTTLMEEYPDLAEQGAIYLDVWPIFPPILAVVDPDMSAQFIQDPSLPKHEHLRQEFMPFTQCKDIVSSDGAEWKTWRAIFNPGFSLKNLTALMPLLLEEIETFRGWLKASAKSGEPVSLEGQNIKLTVDLIGRATLDAKMELQKRDNPFYTAISQQVRLIITDYSPQSLLTVLNPLRPLLMWNNNRIMRNYLTPHIERHVGERLNTDHQAAGPKPITSLAIGAYLSSTPTKTTTLDPNFLSTLIAQLKVFVFAGHDTTAATLSFVFHNIYRYPHVLASVRAELDSVLGPNLSTTRQHISDSPHLLNQLPYTQAVIKETLRLFPPAGSIRQTAPGSTHVLTNPRSGQRLPTQGFMLLDCHFASQRNPVIWERVNEFLPERFLAREGKPLHVRKNAFRAFGLGPRSCLGQELALLEMKAVVAMTVREFEMESVLEADKEGRSVQGDRVYQAQVAGQPTPHPKGE